MRYMHYTSPITGIVYVVEDIRPIPKQYKMSAEARARISAAKKGQKYKPRAPKVLA